MWTWKIYQEFLSFYFNFHQNQSTRISPWLSFIRRIQFSLRMTIAFLVSAFLAYGTGLNSHLSSQYLIPVMSILSIQETVGMTIGASYEMLKTITPLSVGLFVIQRIGLGYEEYIAAEILLLVSSLLISYKCVQVQTRKIALLINSIFFATIVNTENLPSTFIFLLLEEFVIGIGVALIISILIFPFFATIDIENRLNYCLYSFQEMQRWIIQAFLCSDKMHAQVHLARASTVEQMVRNAMNPMHSRLREAYYEPSRLLQRIFNRKRKELIDIKLQEQEDLLSSLMFHVSSLGLMVKKCHFNEYHHHFIQELQPNLLHFDSCQTRVINSLTTFPSVNRTYFNTQLAAYQNATNSLRQAFIEARLRRIQHVVETGSNMRSEDHLSHTFFVFQLGAIERLLLRSTTVVESNETPYQKLKRFVEKLFKSKTTHRTIKQYFKPQWPRFLSALKSMIIVGIGSIFVMVPILAKTFENGQWILITLCMTQGDTVGGALNTMKMRLIGTLFGAMWAYVTYISVYDHVYHTIGMLVPWILLFGYLKLLPQWNYAGTVAAFTPALINLGRIPYGDAVPAGNYALLRIEENLVGIAIAIVLTIGIFPVFAIDVLKNNIQTTLQACRQSVDSMHSIYDRLFHGEHDNILYMDSSESSNDKEVEPEDEDEEITSFADAQRSRFHQLISTQRTLVQHASLEPTLWWFKNSFSTNRYSVLVDQQIDLFRMLHNIDAILMRINECANENDQENEIKTLQMSATGSYFLPDLHTELANLSQQLGDCLNLWLSYFALTQTRFYRIFRDCTYSRMKLLPSDLQRHEQILVELHQTIHDLRSQHQKSVDRLLEYYIDSLADGQSPTNFIPYAQNKNVDVILIGLSAMYYSTGELVQAALALGTNIHTLFELETTRLYYPF